MAAKLQCEICGGKLIGKPGGVFECDSCGTEYSTEWAKAKIQEINGTVRVEGTVNVQGKVQIEGPVKIEGATNKESLLMRGNLALEDGKWNDAIAFFNEALNTDAGYAEAYLGLVLASQELTNAEKLESVADERIIENNADYDKFRRFASKEAKEQIDVLLSHARILREKRDAEKEALRTSKPKELSEIRKRIHPAQSLISANGYTVGLKADGSVVIAGWGENSPCGASNWKRIKAIAIGDGCIVGLTTDGSVVTTAEEGYFENHGQCDVAEWNGIVSIASGPWHTVGLKADGTVLAVGLDDHGQCDVSGWTNISAITAGDGFTMGLKADGTVVVTGNALDVSEWANIVAIAAKWTHAAGLKSDGTVVTAGTNYSGERDIEEWSDIVAIDVGYELTVGLKSNGTVLANGRDYDDYEGQFEVEVSKLKGIVAIAAGAGQTVALDSDGKVFAIGNNEREECNVSDWRLFSSLESLESEISKTAECAEQERNEATEHAERESREEAERIKAIRERRQQELAAEQAKLKTELANLKGLFSGKRRKEIEARLAGIDADLKKLDYNMTL